MAIFSTGFDTIVGVWFIYSYDVGPEVTYISEDPVSIIIVLAKQGYGNIGFWPTKLNMDLKSAISWWEEEIQNVNGTISSSGKSS